VNPTNGSCANLHSWNTSPVVEQAHSNGVKVVLTATLFGSSSNQRLLTNATACAALIDDLVSVVSNRGGDGVCIDFEDVGSWSGATKALTSFMSNLTVRFHQDLPGSEVSIALPSVDWYADFDVASYEAFGMDYGLVMGYDYYYSGSSTPGPVAPLYSSAQWFGASSWCSIDYSVSYYSARGWVQKVSWPCLLGRQWRLRFHAGGGQSGSSIHRQKLFAGLCRAISYGRQWDTMVPCRNMCYQHVYLSSVFMTIRKSGLKYVYALGQGLAHRDFELVAGSRAGVVGPIDEGVRGRRNEGAIRAGSLRHRCRGKFLL
jgi:hypothetical protein